ncbi:hypothetical protein ASPSYDRAFT_138079 [Aspergillus sydowii CBS 593.65]|jgi:hypothetical protein|uniref:Uncharacterized protein n=1 Tax=Aspergillus sydowii CBS 593.65 TaxID=1036612 RepID=A0A1L9SXY2_9EURO|nr:uncharacterized protein ASPSYDRAFT_138079 [Aspergillus sydowii CBS 593.65]OJJ52084.1 hypothetical protein ASPSYDRAFT_138079 [Aspergillus sydowii CBS 593.65]
MSQRKPSTVEAIREARGEGLLQSPISSEVQKNKAQSMFSATKEPEAPEDPLGEPYQKLRDSPAPAPTAAHPNRRLSEASRRMFARKMHEMGEEPEEVLLL